MSELSNHSVASRLGTAYWRGWLLSGILAGCTATLPSALPSLTQAPNCGDVRSGRISWAAMRSSDVDPSDAQRQAIDETLGQLAKQLSGAEIRSLSRAANSLNNETYSTEFQSADYAKTIGRVLDYRVLNVSHQTIADERQIHVEVEGRVCADDLVKSPLIVAIRDTVGLSTYALRTLESALSKSLARDPRLALADRMALGTYHDIEIRASIHGPRLSSVDRRAAISSIQASVGSEAVAGVAEHATRVSLQAILEATMPINPG